MTETETQASAPPFYLVADLTVRDQYKLLPYAAEVRPLMARFGGEILGGARASARRQVIGTGGRRPREKAPAAAADPCPRDPPTDARPHAPLRVAAAGPSRPEIANTVSGYVFGSARGERRRLELLDQAFRPSSEALLRRAIEHPPTLAYDLGCGIGTTTRLMARVTGAERSVGLDDSAALLNAARARAGRAVSFARHDVTESPFPQGSADMVFARFLLAHLQRPATTASSWTSQLREGGLLVLEEIEWIEADQRALAAHVALVGKLISSTGTTMCAGPQLWSLRGDPALELRFAEVVEVSVPTGLAARMFGLSLAGWGRHAARLGLVTESERLGLARELDDLVISRAESEIRWGLHQACFRRVCS